MSTMKNVTTSATDDIDLRELLTTLWRGKYLVLGFTVIAAVTSVVTVLLLPNIYRAEALLVPAKLDNSNDLGALANQFGGIANIVGIDLQQQNGVSETDYALELARSRKFLSEFIESNEDFLVELMAVEAWDEEAGKLIIDSELYDKKERKWIRRVGPDKTPKPSLQEAHRVFLKKFSIERDDDKDFILFQFEHLSPVSAKKWLDRIITHLNATIRDQDVREATDAIAYLENQIQRTNYTDIVNVFYRLIEEQTKTLLLANITAEYSLRTVDPAVAPEQHAWPKRALICMIGTIAGGLVGSLIVLLIPYPRQPKRT